MALADLEPTKLNQDQKALFGRLSDDWNQEVFFKGPEIDMPRLREGLRAIYRFTGISMPEIRIFDGPVGCQIAAETLKVRAGGYWRLKPEMWHAIDTRMWSLLWWNVLGELLGKRESRVLLNLEEAIMQCIQKRTYHLQERVHDFSEDNLLKRYRSVASFDFIRQTLGVHDEKIDAYLEFLRGGAFLSILFHGAALICRRPAAVRHNSQGRLHCDGGPALEWKDGLKEHFLNGVRVPELIAVTPAGELDPMLVLRAKNAEVRKEIVRKIGAGRVVQGLGGKVIDVWEDYELLRLDIPNMHPKPVYLKMKNPSTGTFHVEGVPPNIRTCRDALSWRVGGLKWNPEQLT